MTRSNAAYSLLLPGKVLHLSALNVQRKFRDRGNKAGAKDSWRLLSERGLGELKEFKARRGTDIVSSTFTCVYALMYFYYPSMYVYSSPIGLLLDGGLRS